jgi:hypothetical protein
LPIAELSQLLLLSIPILCVSLKSVDPLDGAILWIPLRLVETALLPLLLLTPKLGIGGKEKFHSKQQAEEMHCV